MFALATLGTCLFPMASASAAINITVMNSNITSNGAGVLDIKITGEAGDLVQFSQLELLITPNVATSNLQFAAPQATDYVNDPDYLYFLNSFNQIDSNDARVVGSNNTFRVRSAKDRLLSEEARVGYSLGSGSASSSAFHTSGRS
jgi:hypothetical protein